VVLHWKGNSGTGPRDIQLKGAQMEIGGKQLLKDTDLTLVFGRKYGLVGHTTLPAPLSPAAAASPEA
jgi:hypothetical protein